MSKGKESNNNIARIRKLLSKLAKKYNMNDALMQLPLKTNSNNGRNNAKNNGRR